MPDTNPPRYLHTAIAIGSIATAFILYALEVGGAAAAAAAVTSAAAAAAAAALAPPAAPAAPPHPT